MHNWWIAALEEFGLINRDEAEHISEQIRLSIHKDRYKETYEELHAILSKKKLESQHIMDDLHNEILHIRSEIDKLKDKEPLKKIVASKK